MPSLCVRRYRLPRPTRIFVWVFVPRQHFVTQPNRITRSFKSGLLLRKDKNVIVVKREHATVFSRFSFLPDHRGDKVCTPENLVAENFQVVSFVVVNRNPD